MAPPPPARRPHPFLDAKPKSSTVRTKKKSISASDATTDISSANTTVSTSAVSKDHSSLPTKQKKASTVKSNVAPVNAHRPTSIKKRATRTMSKTTKVETVALPKAIPTNPTRKEMVKSVPSYMRPTTASRSLHNKGKDSIGTSSAVVRSSSDEKRDVPVSMDWSREYAVHPKMFQSSQEREDATQQLKTIARASTTSSKKSKAVITRRQTSTSSNEDDELGELMSTQLNTATFTNADDNIIASDLQHIYIDDADGRKDNIDLSLDSVNTGKAELIESEDRPIVRPMESTIVARQSANGEHRIPSVSRRSGRSCSTSDVIDETKVSTSSGSHNRLRRNTDKRLSTGSSRGSARAKSSTPTTGRNRSISPGIHASSRGTTPVGTGTQHRGRLSSTGSTGSTISPLPPRSMPKQWVETRKGRTKSPSGTKEHPEAVLRHDLFRNTFELTADHMGVCGADIDAKFNMADSYNGNYTFRVRGPGLMGPYLDENDLPSCHGNDGDDEVTTVSRSFLTGGGGWIVGLKPGKEYWVEVDADPTVQSDVQQVIDIATNEIARLNVPSSFGKDSGECFDVINSAPDVEASVPQAYREVTLSMDDCL